jgi:hypothetical protein
MDEQDTYTYDLWNEIKEKLEKIDNWFFNNIRREYDSGYIYAKIESMLNDIKDIKYKIYDMEE